uniref:Uncharacterized protein n=1 Tax=Timema poppense TaxID=170557 RepID=A0A7R9GTT9_TIMPO|nr:unnamed protein product [Timema poppensis]
MCNQALYYKLCVKLTCSVFNEATAKADREDLLDLLFVQDIFRSIKNNFVFKSLVPFKKCTPQNIVVGVDVNNKIKYLTQN